MARNPAKSPPPRLARAILQRTRGRTNGPATRLMSPSDLGEILKPFVFLDLFDHEGAPFTAGLHPHSGIATLTYLAEGAVSYVAGRTRGFQLWIALPPKQTCPYSRATRRNIDVAINVM